MYKCYVALVAVVFLLVNKQKDSSKDAAKKPIKVLLKYTAFAKTFLKKSLHTLTLINEHAYAINLKSDVILLLSPIYLLAKYKLKVF